MYLLRLLYTLSFNLHIHTLRSKYDHLQFKVKRLKLSRLHNMSKVTQVNKIFTLYLADSKAHSLSQNTPAPSSQRHIGFLSSPTGEDCLEKKTARDAVAGGLMSHRAVAMTISHQTDKVTKSFLFSCKQ